MTKLRAAVPMLHVPDVEATARWYEALGFVVRDLGRDDSEVGWAALRCGDSEIMLNTGGTSSQARRRDADLYVHATAIDALFAGLAEEVEVIEAPHDTFYGMREFIVRDCNGFWITFGEPLAN